MLYKIMKVQALYQNYNYNYRFAKNNQETKLDSSKTNNPLLNNCYYYPSNISFGLANAKKLRRLFSYGMPCMYTGVEMIDPQKVSVLLKNKTFNCSAHAVINALKPFEESIVGLEKEVYNLIKIQAKHDPNKKIKDVVQNILPLYKKQLENEQEPIFKTLIAYSYALPDKHAERFIGLMERTRDKISGRPITVPFSVTEFRYKLGKVKEDVNNLKDKKSLAIVNQIVKMSEDFEPKTNSSNIDKHKKIVEDMENYVKLSALKDNEKLLELIQTSKAKLNSEKILVPFSRKAFIYDLSQILDDLEDVNLKVIFLKVAKKLPTSKNNIYAYITKAAGEPSEKIVYRLLWPSFASVEHIRPKSLGGKDKMKNYGGATASANSKRQSNDFTIQVEREPDTPKNCQKYVDRLIKYAQDGIFEIENIDVKYIEDFKEAVAYESEGAVIVDTSKLYENGRFPKPEPAL